MSEARGRFMIEAAAGRDLGTMAAVRADRATVERAVEGAAEVWVANHNAPAQTVLSGSKAGIAAATAQLERIGLALPADPGRRCIPFADRRACGRSVGGPDPSATTKTAGHCRLFEPDGQELPERRGSLARGAFTSISSARSNSSPRSRRCTPMARAFSCPWGRRALRPAMIRQILEGKPHRAVVCDDGSGGVNGLLQSVGALLAEGAELDLARLWRGRDCRLLDDSLAASPRGEAPAPHMWLLNGGGARPYGTPPLPTLTLEDAVRDAENCSGDARRKRLLKFQINHSRGVASRSVPAIRPPARERGEENHGRRRTGRRPRGRPGRIPDNHAAVSGNPGKHHARVSGRRSARRAARGRFCSRYRAAAGAPATPRPAPGPPGNLRPQVNGTGGRPVLPIARLAAAAKSPVAAPSPAVQSRLHAPAQNGSAAPQ